MNNLFRMLGRLPDAPATVPMFRATQFDSLSSRDEAYQTAFAKRTRQALRGFGMKGEPADAGARLVYRSGPQSLELYRASESLWWTNHDLAYRETTPDQSELPAEAKAREMAAQALDQAKLDAREAHIADVIPVEALIAEPGGKPRPVTTGIDVNYRFSLGELPVFGPGAKIKVSFAPGGRLAQVIYFWRRPRRAAALPALSPGEALERFQRDPAFFRLRDTEAVVEIHKVQLGYFALSPGDFQRFYVPVYAIDATTRTREFSRYDFRRYVVAVQISPQEAKGMDAVANPAACRMF